MKIMRPSQGNYVAVNRASGKISFKDITDSLDNIMQNITEDHLYQLIICAPDIDLCAIAPKTNKVAYYFNQAYKKLSGVTLAIVSEKAFDFDISRLILIQAESATTTIQIFRNEQMARNWLQNERCQNINQADQAQLNILSHKA